MRLVFHNNYIVSFHLNGSGYLVQNSYTPGGGVALDNQVLRTNGRAWGLCDAWVDGANNVNVVYAKASGGGGYISYYDGAWHERDGSTF